MSVPEQVPYKEYRATGSSNTFEITFYLPDPKDLVVMVNKEIPPVGAYSIQGNTVVFNTPPNEGDLVELTRDTQLDRETNFKSYDNSFRPETINFDLDKIWLVLQESNLVDAKILARLKQEIEWRRTHDFNYDELAQVREKQLFDALKGYTDTLNAATNPGVFQGVIAGVVFAQDGKSIQTHLEEILEALAQERENIDSKADKSYVDGQLDLKADQQNTYNKTEVDTALSAVAGGHKAYTTLALAQAAQGTLPVNTIVEVTNDPTTSNNGTYQWNGTTLTKSAYDPLTQAKADATTKANAAEAGAKAYVDLLDSKIGYYQTENILDPSQATEVGYLLNGAPNGVSGSITALTYYSILPNQKFWVRGNSGSNIIAVYGSNKEHIGNIDYNSAVDGVLTVASNYSGKTPAFIRLSLFGKTSLLDFEFGYGWLRPDNKLAYLEKYVKTINENFIKTVGFDYIKTRPEILKDVIDTTVNDYYGKHLVKFENLINPNQDLIQGYYTNTGYVTPAPTAPNFYLTTNFIPVPKSRKFWAKGLNFSSTEQLIQLCDVNKKPILATTTSAIGTSTLTIPLKAGSSNSEVFYIRIGSANGIDFIRNGGLSVGWLSTTPPTIYPAYGAPYAILSNDIIQNVAERINVSNALLGKKWVAMGDSITAAANSYCDVIASRYSAILNKSHSKSEACIHRKTPEDTRLILSEEYLNIATENPPDIITIAAGTNDFVTGTPMSIGTMSDRTNTTFYGALHVLLSGLRARFPSTRIGFISQIPRGGTRYTQYDTNTSDKQKAVVMVCEYYSIPLWEGYKEFGFHPDDSDVMAANLMPDKLHPNNAGHIWYANRIEDFILRLAK